jgi:hypothetical protein
MPPPDAPHFGEVGLDPRHEHEEDDADVSKMADDGEKAWRRIDRP